jgi:uncharacterized protein with HEPN domain
MKHDANIERLRHISSAAGLILEFMAGKSPQDFMADQMLSSSVLYQFLIIGEATRFLDPKILEAYDYPWHLPRSFRNYIAHEYFEINLNQVYNTVRDILPVFKVLIDRMIGDIEGHTSSGCSIIG